MKKFNLSLISGVVVFSAALSGFTGAWADNLPRGNAKELGFDPDRLTRMDATFEELIDKGMIPGAVIMVLRDGQIAHLSSLGKRTPDGEPMTEDSLFRIYSMTKPVTTVAAMMLVEEGKLALNAPVSSYLPAFKDLTVATGEKDADGNAMTRAAKGTMTVLDLMRHTSGLTYGFFGVGPAREAYNEAGVGSAENTALEQANLIATLPLEHDPGTKWEYSRSTDVLGAVVEVVSGTNLEEFMKTRIFDPLGMVDTAFYVDVESDFARIAEPFADQANIGERPVFDPRVRKPNLSGGGGLMSTAHDYAKFAQMMLNGGELNGTRLLSPKTVQLMTSNHMRNIEPGKYYLPGEGYGFGLGYAVRLENGNAPSFGTAGDYNWGGAAGTAYYTDPEESLIALLMIQSPANRSSLRLIFRNLVYPTIADSKVEN
ncbi:serine hydrolase domain-containing protein [Sulfitobacter guttiformis]|uniref:CubicO group peptidase (Beta-lactamase class C family) n=1 Tax=Sulfitobacter guttiformis TaxID=74349 RepID=A0A420DU53_9RHOB|nr:serine hydrolase domain-containing protein [Sulfitobacter guttiformis]KIN71248.1 putative penicillin binding protein [Sulfitobacter guttiformis KCTC 32187]RKE97713.1 CubicO group peptidase (beta-lactamase class C family) [Sulfitobacter guttiformis]